MAKYATTEDHYQCWGCGFHIPIRSMWTRKEFPHTYRCPRCEENILFIDEYVGRAGAYFGSLKYVDYTDPLFCTVGNVPVLNGVPLRSVL